MLCGVHMFHPVNGRYGFDALPKPEVDISIPSYDILKDMLIREDELRLSEKFQNLFADPGNNAIHVAELVQQQVADEFGYKGEDAPKIIDVLRAVISFYPEKKDEITKIPHYLKFNRSARGSFEIGDPIKDVRLAKLNGEETSLFKYMEGTKYPSKPFLICTGSYSWLPFCAYVDDMHALLSKFSRIVNFLVIYIAEAHAIDEWPVGDPLKIMQPISTIERVGIASKFKKDYNFLLPMLVDTVQNEFEQTYSAWPIRFYVIHEDKIVFKANPDALNTYDSIPPQVDAILTKFQNNGCFEELF